MNDQGFQGTGSRFNSRFEAGSPILAKQLNDLAAGIQASLPMPYLGEGSSVSYIPGGSIITSQGAQIASAQIIQQFQVNLFSQPASSGSGVDWFVQIAKGIVMTDTLIGNTVSGSNGALNDTAMKTGEFEIDRVAVYLTGSNTDGTDANSVWCNSGGKFKLPSASIGTFTPPLFFFIVRNAYAPTGGSGSVPTGLRVGWPYLALIQASSDADTKTQPFISGTDTLYDDSLYYIQNVGMSNVEVDVYEPGFDEPVVYNFPVTSTGPSTQNLYNYNCQRLVIATLAWDSVKGVWNLNQSCIGTITLPFALTCKYTNFQTSSYTTAPLYPDKQNAWYGGYSSYDSNYINATNEISSVT